MIMIHMRMFLFLRNSLLSIDNLVHSLVFRWQISMGTGMSKPTNQTRGFYFDDDIGMGARALMEMFGDDG